MVNLCSAINDKVVLSNTKLQIDVQREKWRWFLPLTCYESGEDNPEWSKNQMRFSNSLESKTTSNKYGILASTFSPLFILGQPCSFVRTQCEANELNGFFVMVISESNSSQMFFKIGVLENFVIFTGKQLCWSLFLIKL